jgi:superoxide dismutase, Cu-Zn family
MKKVQTFAFIALAIGLSFFAVSSVVAQDQVGDDPFQVTISSMAPILDAEGNQLGIAAVGSDEQDGPGLMIMVQGLVEGEHGVHLHESGNCDPAGESTFEQAGGHFNPGGMTHPNHAGDLGNLVVDANGYAVLLAGLGAATFDDGEWGLDDADGTALVIHETVDDLATDPSGNSGARIACAVIAPAS